MSRLRQVTESSMLVPTGDLRWVFAHDNYRELLAARFLHMRNQPPQPQRQPLWIGDGEARHIVPAHQKVAAWHATSDAPLFGDLLRDGPSPAPVQPARHRTGAYSGSASSRLVVTLREA